jgi:hypothetical protein
VSLSCGSGFANETSETAWAILSRLQGAGIAEALDRWNARQKPLTIEQINLNLEQMSAQVDRQPSSSACQPRTSDSRIQEPSPAKHTQTWPAACTRAVQPESARTLDTNPALR